MNQSNLHRFGFESLHAYQHALAAMKFVAARRDKLRGLPGKGAEQLERAMVGAYSNVCSAALATGADRKRQFRIALFEAGEAGGNLELPLLYGAFSQSEYAQLRETLTRLCACLRGLTR